jgi:RNA polymerase sigma factor (sigma-70 family)
MRFWKNYKAYLEDFAQSKKIIYGIALNVYREWVRSSLKNETLCVDDFWEQLAKEEQISSIDPWLNSDYEKQHQELKKRLKITISQLPEKQKLVLEYRFLHRLTRKETAARMNTTEDNVYTYQKRAVKALKQIVNSVNNLENTDTT